MVRAGRSRNCREPAIGAYMHSELAIGAGIVAIGRNEGERLRRCLASVSGEGHTVVYVDSGSSDGSSELAHAAGAHVVELDMSSHFTAARARNAGFARLMEVAPDTEFVQFIDGDCELDSAWLATAADALRERPAVSVVCGRRRERFPDASVYNGLCDVEWDTPVGESNSCGGDALMRARAFELVGGYDPGMIAGEEPDLCLRLKRRGFQILRLEVEMTLHDAAMTRWTQWWQRAVRTGHTAAELLAKYGPAPEHLRMRRALSAVLWAVCVPLVWLALAAGALFTGNPFLIALALCAPLPLYARLFVRIRQRCRRAGRSSALAGAYAVSCILAKWPETWGMLLYSVRRLLGKQPHWIEYKDGPAALNRADSFTVAHELAGMEPERSR